MSAIRTVAMGMLLLSPLPSAARGEPMVVKLVVKQDGQEKPAPDHVTLISGGHSLEVPVREGRFEVPPNVLDAHAVAFVADIGVERIRVPGIFGGKFVRSTWTLLLAESAYGEDYDWIVPKDADIRSSCILVFHPDEHEGTGMFVANCRSTAD